MAPKLNVSMLDRDRASIVFTDEAGRQIQLVQRREQLEGLIQALGAVHAQMVDDRAMPPIANAEFNVTAGSNWCTFPVEEGSIVAFWDRGYGPVAIHLPPDEVETLHTLLSRQIEARRRPSGPGH